MSLAEIDRAVGSDSRVPGTLIRARVPRGLAVSIVLVLKANPDRFVEVAAGVWGRRSDGPDAGVRSRQPRRPLADGGAAALVPPDPAPDVDAVARPGGRVFRRRRLDLDQGWRPAGSAAGASPLALTCAGCADPKRPPRYTSRIEECCCVRGVADVGQSWAGSLPGASGDSGQSSPQSSVDRSVSGFNGRTPGPYPIAHHWLDRRRPETELTTAAAQRPPPGP